MNWYKISQNEPFQINDINDMVYKSWIDPNDKIYDLEIKDIHTGWIDKFSDYLKEKYGYSDLNYKKLLSDRWIAVWRIGNMFYFAINDLEDISQLKKIENILFVLDPNFVNIKDIRGYKHGFKWKDFLNSGESFTNYIISHREDF